MTFHRAYFPQPGPQPPYVVAVIALDEGVSMISNLLTESPSVGMRVRACFEDAEGRPVVRFRPE